MLLKLALPIARAGILCMMASVVMSCLTTPLNAQGSNFGRTTAPSVGGTGGTPPPPVNRFATITGNFMPNQRTPGGQSCISVHPAIIPQTANPHIYSHMVLVGNICGQTIKVQVCYYQTTSCIVMSLGGYQKLDRVLGVSGGKTDFRYEFRELL